VNPKYTGTVDVEDLQRRVEAFRVDAEGLITAADYLEKVNGHAYGESHDLRTHAKALRFAMDSIAELYEIPF